MSDNTNKGKRRTLIALTSAVGGVASAAAAWPFVMTMTPSQRAKALGAPVEVDISKLEPGGKIDVEWRGKVVWIVGRTKEMLDTLPKMDERVNDPKSDKNFQPEYAKNIHRSIKPEIFIAVGICSHLGCSPTFRKEMGAADLGSDWLGGFFCPCHGSKFDIAGRVFKGVPAPDNLEVPQHKYLSDTLLLIGDDGKGA